MKSLNDAMSDRVPLRISVASLRNDGRLSPRYLLSLNFVAFGAWNAGTWLGLAAGTALPQAIQSSKGISLYAMFIGLLVPSLRKSKPAAVVAALSIATSLFLHQIPPFSQLSSGWIIMLSTAAAPTAGAWLFPADERKGEADA